MSQPRVPHYEAALHVLKYFSSTSDFGLFFNNSPSFSLVGYCDSYWASCSSSRKSVSVYVLLLGGCPVSWKLKKQVTIALSSAEAKYRALRKLVAEIVWLVRLLDELTVPSVVPVSIDSQIADVLTKALPGVQHGTLFSKLGMVSHSSLRGDVNT
ncbi:secreted RxLR effector protein 161-like [Lycium ferocissimum]|uniref:secreted RxLR effector protein 161-like n=1 Tax=Lycium ferocissimum TaxID=112874 RepID=UPI0028166EEC|nr:secreted RxLR effector protein 161-like [Lycium ferocissimum]